jgi:hypothetical protein
MLLFLNMSAGWKRERESEREKLRGETLYFRGEKHIAASKVSRLVLLVEISLREGKSVGLEKGKVLGCGLFYDQRREVEPGFSCV